MPHDLPEIDPELHRRLEADILARGCIIPIVVTKDGQVIDGKLRLAICEEHGLDCPRIFVAGDDPAGLRIALNSYRRQLSRHQVKEIIRWELQRLPPASDRSIAAKIGVSPTTVGKIRSSVQIGQLESSRLGADGKVRRVPTVVHAPTPTMARQAQKVLQELEELPEGVVSPRDLRVKLHEQRQAKKAATPVASLPAEVDLRLGDFRTLDWSKYEGNAAAVICDPPWLKEFATHRADLAALCRRLLRPGGVLAIYTGQYDLPDWFSKLGKELNYVWQLAGINEGCGTLRVHGNRGTIMTCWRPVLIYSNGPMKNERVLYDVLRSEKAKEWHPWEQPVSEARKLVETLSEPGDVIVDPCSGSGSTLAGVLLAGQGRRAVGCDIDPNAFQAARSKVSKTASSCLQASI